MTYNFNINTSRNWMTATGATIKEHSDYCRATISWEDGDFVTFDSDSRKESEDELNRLSWGE